MNQQETENKEMRITRLEEEINDARESLWELMQSDEDQEKINNLAAYVRYLENHK